MKLHQLFPRQHKKHARIGRGGKRGTTSGRGTKGQKSRSGHRIRPAMRDLILRIPKHRGFRNKPLSEKPLVVSLASFEKKLHPLSLSQGGVLGVDRAVLQKAGLIPPRFRGAIKILGKGTLSLKVALKGIAASEGARQAIQKAGGEVIGE